MKSIHANTCTNLEVRRRKMSNCDLVVKKTTVIPSFSLKERDDSAKVETIVLTITEQRALFNELKHLLS